MTSPEYQRCVTYMVLRARNQMTPDLAAKFQADKAQAQWPRMVKAYELSKRVAVAEYTTRADQFKLLQEARVYIDGAKIPDLWLQSQAVSAGVPQIVRRADELLIPDQNGAVCLQLDQMMPQASQYLDHLRKWSESLVADATLLEQFTADKLFAQWQEAIK